jgi:hypothetical protein
VARKLFLNQKANAMKIYYKYRYCLLSVLIITCLNSAVFSQKIRRIKGMEIDSFSFILDSNYIRLPGYPFPIALKVISKNNGVLYTRGLGGGNLKWSDFIITVKGGTFYNGKINISHLLYPGDYIEIIASGKYHPALKKSQIIRLNYVQNLNLFPLSSFNKIPGERFNFGMKLKYDNGCSETVTSWNQNYKLMNSLRFQFQPVGGKVRNNSFLIDPEFENIPNHTISLRTNTPQRIYASDSLGFVLDYRGNFRYYTEAPDGDDGRNGCDGSNGSDGSESHNGGDGGHGSCGESGGYGEDGYFLEVFCDAYFDTIVNSTLLYVEVKNPERAAMKKYLVNPDGGSVQIVSSGGDGGDGGRGGSGGSGGRGGDGKKYTREVKDTSGTKYIVCQENGGNGGKGGQGGNGGYGGHGGRGGVIDIFYTNSARPYLSCIKPLCPGGSSGSGGAGGSGGTGGGSGSPGGSSGSAGSSGSSAFSGYSGDHGIINWHLTDD